MTTIRTSVHNTQTQTGTDIELKTKQLSSYEVGIYTRIHAFSMCAPHQYANVPSHRILKRTATYFSLKVFLKRELASY